MRNLTLILYHNNIISCVKILRQRISTHLLGAMTYLLNPNFLIKVAYLSNETDFK